MIKEVLVVSMIAVAIILAISVGRRLLDSSYWSLSDAEKACGFNCELFVDKFEYTDGQYD